MSSNRSAEPCGKPTAMFNSRSEPALSLTTPGPEPDPPGVAVKIMVSAAESLSTIRRRADRSEPSRAAPTALNTMSSPAPSSKMSSTTSKSKTAEALLEPAGMVTDLRFAGGGMSLAGITNCVEAPKWVPMVKTSAPSCTVSSVTRNRKVTKPPAVPVRK